MNISFTTLEQDLIRNGFKFKDGFFKYRNYAIYYYQNIFELVAIINDKYNCIIKIEYSYPDDISNDIIVDEKQYKQFIFELSKCSRYDKLIKLNSQKF